MAIPRNLSILAQGASASGVLSVTYGGTGVTTSTGTGSVVLSASPTFTGSVTFPGTGIWNSSGNVGIGTSSPAASLSITKQTTTLSGTGNAYGLYAYPTSSGLVYIDAVTSGAGNTSLGLRTYSNGTYNDAVRIDSSGNVGIGTSSPNFNGVTGTVCHINNPASTIGTTIWAINHYTNGKTGSAANDGTIVGQLDADAYVYNYETGNIIFGTSAIERMRIDSSGIITAPNQTAFNAYGGGTQSFGGAQSTVVVQFNVQNSLGVRSTGYNTSTYRFTAPVSGAYLLCGRIVNTTSGSTGPELTFRVNGSSAYYAAINYANNAYVTTSGQVVVYLNASDYVEACITNNNSTSFTLDLTRSNFCGFLIG